MRGAREPTGPGNQTGSSEACPPSPPVLDKNQTSNVIYFGRTKEQIPRKQPNTFWQKHTSVPFFFSEQTNSHPDFLAKTVSSRANPSLYETVKKRRSKAIKRIPKCFVVPCVFIEPLVHLFKQKPQVVSWYSFNKFRSVSQSVLWRSRNYLILQN